MTVQEFGLCSLKILQTTVLWGAITAVPLPVLTPCGERFPPRYPASLGGDSKAQYRYCSVRVSCEPRVVIGILCVASCTGSLESLAMRAFQARPRRPLGNLTCQGLKLNFRFYYQDAEPGVKASLATPLSRRDISTAQLQVRLVLLSSCKNKTAASIA